MESDKQRKLLDLLLAGKSRKEAAEEVGYTINHVNRLMRPGTDLRKQYEEEKHYTEVEMIQKAVNAIREQLSSENEQTRIKTATWVLDKLGAKTEKATDDKSAQARIMFSELIELDSEKENQ